MIPQEKNKYIKKVVSWMEKGVTKEESREKLRLEGIGFVSADTIVTKSYNLLLNKYTTEVLDYIKNNKEQNIEDYVDKIVPENFSNKVTEVASRRITRVIREQIIFDLDNNVPIKGILDTHQSTIATRKQIKQWIIAYFKNVMSREMLIKKSFMRTGVITIFSGLLLGLILYFYPLRVGKFTLTYHFIYLIAAGLIMFGYGLFKPVSDYPKM
ncbi:MAG: hypothetical protein ACPGVD_00860 [Flavobacteriales bacterium]